MKPISLLSSVLFASALGFAPTSADAQVKTRDHRDSAEKNETVKAKRGGVKTRDHRDQGKADEAPNPRDHRGKPHGRDHRGKVGGDMQVDLKAGGKIDHRDHRQAIQGRLGVEVKGEANVDVRDHRDRPGEAVEAGALPARKNEVVPARRGHAGGVEVRDHRWKIEHPFVSAFGPRVGKAGATVDIYGKNFSDGVTVYINGQAVQPKSITPDHITCVMPELEGEASITLSYPQSRRPVVVGAFRYDKPEKDTWKERRKERIKAAELRWKERRAQFKFEKAKEARQAEREKREAERAANREQRREERLAALRAEWDAAFLADSQTVAEMALHAQRKAKLSRMLRIAESLDKANLVARIEVSMENEDARHERRVATLKAGFKVSAQ